MSLSQPIRPLIPRPPQPARAIAALSIVCCALVGCAASHVTAKSRWDIPTATLNAPAGAGASPAHTHFADGTPSVPAPVTPPAPSVLVPPTPAPFGVGGPLPQSLPTLDPGTYPPGTPEAAPPGATPSPSPSPNPVTSIINYLIQATIYFPAKTFQRAVEKAARAIFTAELELLAQPFREMIDLLLRPDAPIYGREALASGLSGVSEVMTQAAMPLWALSLALLGLAIVTRSASALGYGLGESAHELARWFFVCLLSGNAALIVDLVHGAVTQLAAAIVSVGMGNAAEQLWLGLFPEAMFDPEFSLTLLMLGMLLAMLMVAIMAVSFVARYVLLLILAALAPLAIATEGIPFTRFVCREWLGAFLKVELLHVMNAVVLVVFGRMLTLLAGSGGLTAVILSFVVMVGIVSVISTLNFKVFQYVFGAAIDAASQAVRLTAGLIMFAASGGLSGGLNLATVSGLAGVIGGATGEPATRGLSEGFRIGSNTAQQNETADAARRMRGGGSSSGASAQPEATGRTTYRTPQLQLASARTAQRAQDNQRRAADLQASAAGARGDDERDSVKSAFADLSAAYGADATARAAQAVSPALKAMARQSPQGMSGVAAALGYASAGELAGAFAEENLLGRPGVASPAGGRLFGPPPAQTLLGNSLGAPVASDATKTHAHDHAALSDTSRHGEAAQNDLAQSQGVAPVLSTLAARAGGLEALARKAGFGDIGHLERALQNAGSAPTDMMGAWPENRAPEDRAGFTAARDSLRQQHGTPRTDQALDAAMPALRTLAPAFATAGQSELAPLAQALGYAGTGEMLHDIRQAALTPARGETLTAATTPTTASGQPLASVASALGYPSPAALALTLQAAGAVASGSTAAAPAHTDASPGAGQSAMPMPSTGDGMVAQANGHALQQAPAADRGAQPTQPDPANGSPPSPAITESLPLAQAVLRSPLATPLQQAQALGAGSQRETQGLAHAIRSMNDVHGPEPVREALAQIAPAVHVAGANLGLTGAASALGFANPGAWISAWAVGALTPSQSGAASAPQGAAPVTAAAPTGSPFDTGASAFAPLLAQHGAPAVEAAMAASRPALDTLAARYGQTTGSEGYAGLAARAGFADPSALAAAVTGQQLAPLAPQQLPASPDESPGVNAAMAALRSAYGAPAVDTALNTVAPVLRGLAAATPAQTATAPLSALAETLGYGNAGRMTGALLEGHVLDQQGLAPLAQGPLYAQAPSTSTSAAPATGVSGAGDPAASQSVPVPAPSPALLANALNRDTPPGQPQPFDQIAGMTMAQQLQLPPNFGPVLSNLAWSLRAESPDTGLFWQVHQASAAIGQTHADPKAAYDAFRQYVDDLYAQPGVDAFYRPWQPGLHPLPNRRFPND